MRIDGPLARRLDVVRLQPDWSGEVLDLVVDFVTYVFVPAYAITASGLLMPWRRRFSASASSYRARSISPIGA